MRIYKELLITRAWVWSLARAVSDQLCAGGRIALYPPARLFPRGARSQLGAGVCPLLQSWLEETMTYTPGGKGMEREYRAAVCWQGFLINLMRWCYIKLTVLRSAALEKHAEVRWGNNPVTTHGMGGFGTHLGEKCKTWEYKKRQWGCPLRHCRNVLLHVHVLLQAAGWPSTAHDRRMLFVPRRQRCPASQGLGLIWGSPVAYINLLSFPEHPSRMDVPLKCPGYFYG